MPTRSRDYFLSQHNARYDAATEILFAFSLPVPSGTRFTVFTIPFSPPMLDDPTTITPLLTVQCIVVPPLAKSVACGRFECTRKFTRAFRFSSEYRMCARRYTPCGRGAVDKRPNVTCDTTRKSCYRPLRTGCVAHTECRPLASTRCFHTVSWHLLKK